MLKLLPGISDRISAARKVALLAFWQYDFARATAISDKSQAITVLAWAISLSVINPSAQPISSTFFPDRFGKRDNIRSRRFW